MAKTGQNVNDLKKSNRSLLLNLLYFGGAQSRKALSQKSKLTAAAITIIISELISDGVLIETDKLIVEGRVGRSEQLIDINYNFLYAIGVNIGTTALEISLVDLKCNIVDIKSIPLPAKINELLVSIVKNIIDDIFKCNSIRLDSVVGIGVTIRGIVDSESGISIDSYGILESDFNIASNFKKYIDMPVTVENNVRAMLRADTILKHAHHSRSTLFIKYGPGVGGALIVGQKSYLGSSCHAIELGHVCIAADGEDCICGKIGCLETFISYNSILTKVKRMFSVELTPILFKLCNGDKSTLTIQQIFSAYEKKDAGLEVIINETIKNFAMSISNYASILDPEIILLSFDIFINRRYLDNLQKSIYSFSGKHKPKLIFISDNQKLDKSGAFSIAINEFLATGGQSLKAKK